jgi:peptidoglycan hydrolase-like protein with peptidoglycan-binding domain
MNRRVLLAGAAVAALTAPVLISTPAAAAATAAASSTAAATSAAYFTASWPTIRYGATGHPVRTLQHLLRARGYTVAVDGRYGTGTRAAVIRFQRARGLAADGITGPRTWTAVCVTVRTGVAGEAVRGVEEEFRYRDLNCGCYPIDGRYDARDRSSVTGFQRAVGITPDGVVGPVTWRFLVSGALAG